MVFHQGITQFGIENLKIPVFSFIQEALGNNFFGGGATQVVLLLLIIVQEFIDPGLLALHDERCVIPVYRTTENTMECGHKKK